MIAQYDGVENAGYGIHDANALTWKDLAGNADLTVRSNALTEHNYWISDAYKTTTSTKMNQFEGTLNGNARRWNNDTMTYTCVCRNYTYNNGGIIALRNSDERNYMMLQADNKWSVWASIRSPWNELYQLKKNYSVRDASDVFSFTMVCNGAGTVCNQYFILDDTWTVVHEHGQNAQPVLTDEYAANENTLLTLFGYFPKTFDRSSICELCSVRVYDRTLTTNEVMFNYKVDQIRFCKNN